MSSEWNQSDLAAKAGVGKKTVERFETCIPISIGEAELIEAAFKKKLGDDKVGSLFERPRTSVVGSSPVIPDESGTYPLTQSSSVDKGFKDLRQLYFPDPLAVRRAGSRKFTIIGSAIETLIHSTLNSRTPITKCGWDPARVTIVDTGKVIDSEPILKRLSGGLMPLEPNEANDTKFILSKCEHPTLDDEENLTMWFDKTDWQIHKTVRNAPDGIEKNEDLALEFGSPDVEQNRVPSSVGLHYIVRFADDTVLLLLRRGSVVAHERNRWSISGEEQFEINDFRNSTLLRVFQRTLCEEVVGLLTRSPEILQDIWEKYVADNLETMRLWGLLFEERACVTSLLGFYQFRLSVRDFIKWRKELADQWIGSLDREGKMYWTTTAEIEHLVLGNQCKAWSLDETDSSTVEASMLHKTSRYRAIRLIRAVRGRLPN